MSWLTKWFGGGDGAKYERTMVPLVTAINEWEAKIELLTDLALAGKTAEFRARLTAGAELEALLPEAFAVVREAARRTLGQRHYDVQLLGGIALHQSKIIEMRTGEGKTLVCTLPAYLNALTGRGVHVITVNDYLARRDTVWMGQIYAALGLSVGVINHEASYLYHPENPKSEIRIWTSGATKSVRLRLFMNFSNLVRVARPTPPTSLTAPTTNSVLIISAITWRESRSK